MKRTKKILSILLALIMVVSIIPMSSITGFAVQSAEFYGGNGTEDYPYLISTKEHLDNVRLYPNAHYKLVKDIVFTTQDYGYSGDFYNSGKYWIPIEDFTGVFDGNHHSIDGLKINNSFSGEEINNSWHTSRGYGLFGDMDGKVSNLSLSNVSIQVYASKCVVSYSSSFGVRVFVGAIAGRCINGVITGCSVSGNVRATGNTDLVSVEVGGIVGDVYSDGVITECINVAKVEGVATYKWAQASVGGIVSDFGGSEIKNCTNFGAVSAKSYDGPRASGIATNITGYFNHPCEVSNCYNYGLVEAYSTCTDEEYSEDLSLAGGIIGNASNIDHTIKLCGNFAKVYSKGLRSIVGGIVASEYGNGLVKQCFNSGDIIAETNYWSSLDAGGITGSGGFIEQCYNSGSISLSGTAYLEAGGITSHTFKGISNCYNLGDISVQEDAYFIRTGGIVASCSGYIEYCYNVGNLPSKNASGIVYYIYDGTANYDNDIYILDCYYLNNVGTGVSEIDGDFIVETAKKTSAEMKKESTFKKFDFNDIWIMSIGDYGYPQLRQNRPFNGTKEDVCVRRGNHTWIKNAIISEATCVENGSVEYVCQVCENTKVTPIEALGHSITSYSAQEPNCTEPGWNEYVACDCCDYSTYVEIPATGHNFGDWSVIKAPTCLTDGYEARICEDCNEPGLSSILCDSSTYPESPHNYSNSQTYEFSFSYSEAESLQIKFSEYTETENNYDFIYIYDCEMNQIGKFSGDALKSKEIIVDGDCFTIKMTTDGSVNRYGFSIESIYARTIGGENSRVLTAVGHDYKSEIITPATHMATGLATFTCDCGDTYTGVIEKIEEHSYVADATAPTCEDKGYTTYTCECGDSYVDDYVDATGHSYTSEITTPATHLMTGVMTYTCSCGETYTEEIAKTTEHTYNEVITAPTCEDKGYTTYTCECGDSYVDDYINAKGHTYTSKVTKPATHLETGIMTCTCHCGYSYTETIARIADHTYTLVVTAPTCTEQGYTTYTCECGDTYVDDYVDATGHADNDGDGHCDMDNEVLDPTVDCNCNCHKSGIIKFFFNFILFFQRLFGSNKTCACGIAHY